MFVKDAAFCNGGAMVKMHEINRGASQTFDIYSWEETQNGRYVR